MFLDVRNHPPATSNFDPPLSHICSVLELHNLAAVHKMGTSCTLASAFLSGIFWIEGLDTSYNFGKTTSRMRRFRALLPLPTTKEFILLFEAIELEDYNISNDCWSPYDIPIPGSNTYAMVTCAARGRSWPDATISSCPATQRLGRIFMTRYTRSTQTGAGGATPASDRPVPTSLPGARRGLARRG